MIENENRFCCNKFCLIKIHIVLHPFRLRMQFLLLLLISRVISGTERGMLMNRGTVVEQSRTINFLQQRKDAMHTWWEYAIGNKSSLPKTPSSNRAVNVEEYMEILQQVH